MTIGRMRIACWLTKAADAHTEYVILLFFYCYNDYTNATRCYITRSLPVFLVAEVFYLTMLSAATVSIGHCGNANDSGQVKCCSNTALFTTTSRSPSRADDVCLYCRTLFRRSRWPRGLRRGSAAAGRLGLRVRIPSGAWMSVCCDCFVLSGRGLCDGPIAHSEEFYRVWCVWVWSGNLNNKEASAYEGCRDT
jgi:hypothetical protein